MRNPNRILIVSGLILALGTAAQAANFNQSARDSFFRELPIDPNGVVVIQNPFGNIEVTAHDAPVLYVGVLRVTRGVDAAAIAEGRNVTRFQFGGDARGRIVRTLTAGSPRWQSIVSYSIRVPRTVSVDIESDWSEKIRIANLGGNVTVRNVNGPILLENLTGGLFVESINGSIVYNSGSKPAANARLKTINGHIEMTVSPDASFRWVADTIRGDLLTNLPVTGRFDGSTFRGAINSSRGPVITTAAMLGNVIVMKKGSSPNQVRSVRLLAPEAAAPARQPAAAPSPAGRILIRTFSLPETNGDLRYETNIGNVSIGQVRGSARIVTGAGEVQIGSVQEETTVISHGGPLEFGDLTGRVTAETKAGDISARMIRSGGSLTTGGGIIRVLYSQGALTLRSGGGDIFVRQASGPVSAETRSGDITLNFEPAVTGLPVEARTGQGNVQLNVSPQFAADIEAIVMTSDANVHSILSEFADLSIQRERVGGRTRIRAAGKVNGGGPRVALYAEEGNIQIRAQAVRPLLSPAH